MVRSTILRVRSPLWCIISSKIEAAMPSPKLSSSQSRQIHTTLTSTSNSSGWATARPVPNNFSLLSSLTSRLTNLCMRKTRRVRTRCSTLRISWSTTSIRTTACVRQSMLRWCRAASLVRTTSRWSQMLSFLFKMAASSLTSMTAAGTRSEMERLSQAVGAITRQLASRRPWVQLLYLHRRVRTRWSWWRFLCMALLNIWARMPPPRELLRWAQGRVLSRVTHYPCPSSISTRSVQGNAIL